MMENIKNEAEKNLLMSLIEARKMQKALLVLYTILVSLSVVLAMSIPGIQYMKEVRVTLMIIIDVFIFLDIYFIYFGFLKEPTVYEGHVIGVGSRKMQVTVTCNNGKTITKWITRAKRTDCAIGDSVIFVRMSPCYTVIAQIKKTY